MVLYSNEVIMDKKLNIKPLQILGLSECLDIWTGPNITLTDNDEICNEKRINGN
jgi:hypothetical protein